MALAAEPPAKLEGNVSPRGKMAIETGGKHAPRHGHGADLRALAPGDGQAFVDGLDRYAPAVALLAGDALQRHRRQHPVLLEQAGAGIVAAGIDAENKHGERFRPLAGLAIGEPNLTPNGPRRNGFLAADVPVGVPAMTAPEGLLSRIRSGLPGLAWPPIVTGPLATLVALAREFEESQWLTAAEIEAKQHRQLVVLATHAAAHSPHFARRLAAAGLAPSDLATPEGLRRLPVLRRREIQQAGADFYCSAIPEGHGPLRESRTSGSTGEPVTIRRTAVSQLFWRAVSLRFHAWVRPRSHQALHDHPGRQSRGHGPAPLGRAFEPAVRDRPAAGDPHQYRHCRAGPTPGGIQARQPGGLSQQSRRHPPPLPAHRASSLPGISRILTMSETLSPKVRAAAEAFFEARIFDCYSSGEVGLVALECPESGLYHLMAETVLMEVLDENGNACGPGETGRLVLTDLSNFASPVIRYDIADYAECAEACPCGRGLPSLRADRRARAQSAAPPRRPALLAEAGCGALSGGGARGRASALAARDRPAGDEARGGAAADAEAGEGSGGRRSMPPSATPSGSNSPTSTRRSRAAPAASSRNSSACCRMTRPRPILFRHPGESRGPGASGKLLAPWPLDSGFRRNDERRKDLTLGLSLSSPAR